MGRQVQRLFPGEVPLAGSAEGHLMAAGFVFRLGLEHVLHTGQKDADGAHQGAGQKHADDGQRRPLALPLHVGGGNMK